MLLKENRDTEAIKAKTLLDKIANARPMCEWNKVFLILINNTAAKQQAVQGLERRWKLVIEYEIMTQVLAQENFANVQSAP